MQCSERSKGPGQFAFGSEYAMAYLLQHLGAESMPMPPHADTGVGLYIALNLGTLRAHRFENDGDFVPFREILFEGTGLHQVGMSRLLYECIGEHSRPQESTTAIDDCTSCFVGKAGISTRSGSTGFIVRKSSAYERSGPSDGSAVASVLIALKQLK